MPVLVQSEAFSYNPAATFFRVFFSPPVGRSLLLFTPLSVYTPVQHMQSNGVFPPTTTTPSTNPVGDNLHLILPILETTLQVSCDPDLRMGMLALIATMLENPYVATVCRQREAYGGTMLQRLFLPNAVWRVGRVASSVRKIVTRCISTLLRHRLVTPDALQVLWQERVH